MFVVVNGRTLPLPEPQTLTELLRTLAPAAPFAVAHNNEFVPRGGYNECPLAPGDSIDIVHPSAGG